MNLAHTTYGPGGVTTATAAPDRNDDIKNMMMRALRRGPRAASRPQVPRESLYDRDMKQLAMQNARDQVRRAREDENENYYYKLQHGPGVTSGWVEVSAGTPGAVFAGTRKRSEGLQNQKAPQIHNAALGTAEMPSRASLQPPEQKNARPYGDTRFQGEFGANYDDPGEMFRRAMLERAAGLK